MINKIWYAIKPNKQPFINITMNLFYNETKQDPNVQSYLSLKCYNFLSWHINLRALFNPKAILVEEQ